MARRGKGKRVSRKPTISKTARAKQQKRERRAGAAYGTLLMPGMGTVAGYYAVSHAQRKPGGTGFAMRGSEKRARKLTAKERAQRKKAARAPRRRRRGGRRRR